MNKAVILVFMSVVIGTVGQLCIKTAMLKLGPMAFNTPAEIFYSGWQIMQQPLIWIAIPLYGAGFIIWAVALSRLQLSFAYPLLAIGFIINPAVAMIFFGESISIVRWAGIMTIIIGVVLIGRS